MTSKQFSVFEKFRDEFKQKIEEWESSAENTPIIYNKALDEIKTKSEIKLLIIGDNPGKLEKETGKYFVGQAGKLGEKFFCNNYNKLKICFRKNVIILNKTPIHSARTTDLKKVEQQDLKKLIKESQEWMAEKTLELAKALNIKIWIIGYSELNKPNGIFKEYKNKFLNIKHSSEWENIFVFQHFSRNWFNRDLNKFCKENPNLSLWEALNKLGETHKNKIFGN